MPMHDWTRVPAGTFHTLHTAWITELARTLNNGLLPEPYYAEAEQVAGQTGPDVLTLEWDSDADWPAEARMQSLREGGATALADATPQVSITQVASEEELYARKRNRLAIRHTSGDRLVAFIEILSHGNKSSRRSLDKFLDKAYSVLERGIHLLIVDPYPPGPFDPQGIHGALWSEIDPLSSFQLPEARDLTAVSYRAVRPIQAFVEPLAVGSALPAMPLFLDPDWYVSVPLETTYQSGWETVPLRWRRVLSAP